MIKRDIYNNTCNTAPMLIFPWLQKRLEFPFNLYNDTSFYIAFIRQCMLHLLDAGKQKPVKSVPKASARSGCRNFEKYSFINVLVWLKFSDAYKR